MSILTVAARRRGATLPPTTTPPSLTWTSTERVIISGYPSGEYYAFPGAVKCPNGDILIAFRNGAIHLGSGDLLTARSTDGGATWSTPAIALPRSATDGYGTATLSVIGTSVALVTWMRPLAGGTPLGSRILLSADNGTTWGDPHLVDTSEWLTSYNVSESPLVYRDGWYYLGVWGENSGAPSSYYVAGVVRSTDLTNWTPVAVFNSGGANGYNEIGVTAIGEYLVALVRNETAYRYTSISLNGASWTLPAAQDVNGNTGAPKMGPTFAGVSIVPLRDTASGGFMASVDSAGNLADLGTLTVDPWFIYGQVAQLSPTTGGVAYAVDEAFNELRWRTFSIAAP